MKDINSNPSKVSMSYQMLQQNNQYFEIFENPITSFRNLLALKDINLAMALIDATEKA